MVQSVNAIILAGIGLVLGLVRENKRNLRGLVGRYGYRPSIDAGKVFGGNSRVVPVDTLMNETLGEVPNNYKTDIIFMFQDYKWGYNFRDEEALGIALLQIAAASP